MSQTNENHHVNRPKTELPSHLLSIIYLNLVLPLGNCNGEFRSIYRLIINLHLITQFLTTRFCYLFFQLSKPEHNINQSRFIT